MSTDDSTLMKIPRVYLDTSVIGGCFDPEFERWSNALVADFEAGRLTPVLSAVVAAEVEAALERVRQKFADASRLSTKLLEVSREALEVVGEYSRHGILPPPFGTTCSTSPWRRSRRSTCC